MLRVLDSLGDAGIGFFFFEMPKSQMVGSS